jgi:hypothetical protein
LFFDEFEGESGKFSNILVSEGFIFEETPYSSAFAADFSCSEKS